MSTLITRQNIDPNQNGFQYLENISTAYWYSQVFFTALELKLFSHLDQGHGSVPSLSSAAECKQDALSRLLRALERMELVIHTKGTWKNTNISSKLLVPGKTDYMGGFFLYRKYMRPNWDMLTQKLSTASPAKEKELSYEQKNYLYVAAMDTVVRQKARLISKIIAPLNLKGPILDVGGGAAGMVRGLLKAIPGSRGQVFDIPEVLEAAKQLYPEPDDWQNITTVSGDFRTYEFTESFSLIILSNFLHTYSPKEAKELVLKSARLLNREGYLLIHDYFPDREGVSPQKGALYDLSMMLNTYNGVCHETGPIIQWLKQAGIHMIRVEDLNTDTAIILAGKG